MKRTTLLCLIILCSILLLSACGPRSEPTPAPEIESPTVELDSSTEDPSTDPTEVVADETMTPSDETALPEFPSLADESKARKESLDLVLSKVDLPEEGDPVARINGEEIGVDEYVAFLRLRLDSLGSQYEIDWSSDEIEPLLRDVESQVLEQLIEMILLDQAAEAEGVFIDEVEIQGFMRDVQQSVIQTHGYESWDEYKETLELSDEAFEHIVVQSLLLQRMIEYQEVPTDLEQVHARHILVSDPVLADEIIQRMEDGEAFEALAQEYSEDLGSSSQGGDLGWFPRGVMVQEFEDLAFELEPGEISAPLATVHGVHIVQVLERDTRELSPVYVQQFQQENFFEWLQDLRDEAEIEIFVLQPVG